MADSGVRCFNLNKEQMGKIEMTVQYDDKTIVYSTKCGSFRV
jgi:hypothetical protein